MIVLGVDPGTAATGYGVVGRDPGGALRLVECGVVRPRPGAPLPDRLDTIFQTITELIERHRPDVLADPADRPADVQLDRVVAGAGGHGEEDHGGPRAAPAVRRQRRREVEVDRPEPAALADCVPAQVGTAQAAAPDHFPGYQQPGYRPYQPPVNAP